MSPVDLRGSVLRHNSYGFLCGQLVTSSGPREATAAPVRGHAETSPPQGAYHCVQEIMEYQRRAEWGLSSVRAALTKLTRTLSADAAVLGPWDHAEQQLKAQLSGLLEHGVAGMNTAATVEVLMEKLLRPLQQSVAAAAGLTSSAQTVGVHLQALVAEAVGTGALEEALLHLAGKLKQSEFAMMLAKEAAKDRRRSPAGALPAPAAGVGRGARPAGSGWEFGYPAPSSMAPAGGSQWGQQAGQGNQAQSAGMSSGGQGQLPSPRQAGGWAGQLGSRPCDMWDGQTCHYQQMFRKTCQGSHMPGVPAADWQGRVATAGRRLQQQQSRRQPPLPPPSAAGSVHPSHM